jgi:hypothetical protein
MSFRANSSSEVQISWFTPAMKGQGIHAKALVLQCDQARWPPKTGKVGWIFVNSLLNSLLAGNCGGRKTGL